MDYNFDITGIFPTPILIATLPRDFNSMEIDYINELKNETVNNVGNKVTTNKYVLRNPALDRLNAECHNFLNGFVEKVYDPDQHIEPYVTQSWVNFTNQQEDHHKHLHPNSLISGVVYLNADEEHDKIFFHNDPYRLINPTPKNYNPFNCNNWSFPVKTGTVILFPSHMYHSVETKTGSNTRISLAFNSFIRGSVGSYEGSTELVL